MFAFYDEETNELLGHAHSFLPCHRQDEGDDHPPHVHDQMFQWGPFFCAGLPEVSTYTIEAKTDKGAT